EAQALLAAVGRHVAAIDRQRLLADAQSLAVAHRAGDAGAHHLGAVALDRFVHAIARDDLVADHPALDRLGSELALEEDSLTRELDAAQAGQARVGGSRYEPSLARGQVERGAGLGDPPIHAAQERAAAADREGFHDGKPRLLDQILELLVIGLGPPVAAID